MGKGRIKKKIVSFKPILTDSHIAIATAAPTHCIRWQKVMAV